MTELKTLPKWKQVTHQFTDKIYQDDDNKNPVYELCFTDINIWKATKLKFKKLPCKIYSAGWHFGQHSGHIRVHQSELIACDLL